ncbi:MAG TPA: LysE family transporter [Candidatus Sericytochromatia bacterium]|jgi:threonine/homoserine/homoserine lactone efflux protein
MILSKESVELSATLKQISWKRIFYQFIITNILNPKVALFFVAFLLQFIDVSRGNVAFILSSKTMVCRYCFNGFGDSYCSARKS